LLIAIGFGNFFLSFGGGGPPRFFWCAFLGMPILFIGVTMCMFGFMGAVARFQAGEVAPVGKDTFNYFAEGTKGCVQTLATAVGAGLTHGMAGTDKTARCPKCGHPNDADAKFCDECGAPVLTACPSCGRSNDHDAKFCSDCGSALAR
jgi:membrane protease subunit (stomatin/prohibitin family)